MAEVTADVENLDLALGDLANSIAGTEAVTAAFKTELAGVATVMTATSAQATGFQRSVGTSLRNAFDALVFDGGKLTDVLRGLSLSIADSALDSVLKPVTSGLGNLIGGGLQDLISGILPFENGAAFSSGRVQAFAKGGVVSQATSFPMRGGMGLMGEAGPEAIMPLARGADGKLGVRGGGGGAVQITMNISTPDVAGFQRSKAQIAAQYQRALARGQRNL
ncbi:MAG: phage tail tape measure protein [Rhodobacteraceae bacterium]|nr:phage tail tape measure protein [Paracoccaceae bacterium]